MLVQNIVFEREFDSNRGLGGVSKALVCLLIIIGTTTSAEYELEMAGQFTQIWII